MIQIDIPGSRSLRLDHLVLDVNGTLAVDGLLLPGVAERLAKLRELLALHLLTADTHGRQTEIDSELGLKAVIMRTNAPEAEQKRDYVDNLVAERVVAIGNGENDRLMLRRAALGIAVLGPEGLALAALREADVLAPNIGAALDLLLNPRRLIATLRR